MSLRYSHFCLVMLFAAPLLFAKPGDMPPGKGTPDIGKDLAPDGPAADPAAPPALDDDTFAKAANRLIRQLDAAELSKRDLAETELVRLGARVLPLLPKPGEVLGANAQQALTRIRAKLEVATARAAAESTTVELTGKHTLKHILAELARQTGNKIDHLDRMPPELLDKKHEVTWRAMPFWTALDDICDMAKLTVYPYDQGPGIALRPKPDLLLPRSDLAGYVGPLRLEATNLTLERDPRVVGNPQLRIGLEISWEPRLRPISIELPLEKISAVDDQNKRLESARKEGVATALIPNGTKATELQVLLEAPPRTANILDLVKGKVRMLLPGRVEKFEFENLAESLKPEQKWEKKIAQATVTIERIQRNNDLWEVQMKLSYDQAHDAFDSHLAGWILQYTPQLIDAEGKAQDHAGYDTALRNDKEYGITYYYDIPTIQGAKFIYSCPAVLQRIELEYELKNLRLP
jgi:hypothetical protein